MKRLLAAGLFLLSAVFLPAVEGVVTDSKTGKPVAGAVVSLPGLDTAVRSGSDGRFSIPLQVDGSLLVDREGYRSRLVGAVAGSPLLLRIQLEPEERIRLGKLTVQGGSGPAAPQNSLGAQQITATTTELFKDTYKIIRMLPGVVAGDDMSSLMYIRGGAAYEAIAIMDDLILINPYLWGGMMSVFHPETVRRVKFFNGGFGAEYGQAMSGVLDISLRSGSRTNYGGYLDISPVTFDALLQGHLGVKSGSSFMVSARRTYYDQVMGPGLFGMEDGTELPFFNDLQIKFDFALSPKWRLNMNSMVSYEGMRMVADPDDEDFSEFYYRDLRLLQGVRLSGDLTDRISLRGTAGFRMEGAEYNLASDDTPGSGEQTQREIQTKLDLVYTVSDRLVLKSGAAAFVNWLTLDSTFQIKQLLSTTNSTNAAYYTETRTFHVSSDAWIYSGGYLAAEYRPVKQLTVEAGSRLEYFNITGKVDLTPRLALYWQTAPGTKLKAAAGLYKQFPLFAGGGAAMLEDYGNRDLDSERSRHLLAGIEHDLTEQLQFRLEGYYKYYDRLVVEDPDPAVNYRNSGERKVWGFDLFLLKKPGGAVLPGIDGWISYSWIHARQRINARSNPADFGKPDYVTDVGEWFFPSHDRRHNLTVNVNWRLNLRWQFSLTYRFSTGMPYTPLGGRESYYDTTENETVYNPLWGRYNSERLPDYHRLDIKVAMPFFGLKGFSSFVQFINVFNHENVTAYYWNNDYSERRTQQMMGFFLTFGIRWEF